MKTQSPFLPVTFSRAADMLTCLQSWPLQRRSIVAASFSFVLSAVLLVPSMSASADEGLPPMDGGGTERGQRFDWMRHTQRSLDELKVKLNLAPAQAAGWNTWSQGVLDDGKQQLIPKKNEHDGERSETQAAAMETTPQKMARGIAHFKSETAWMQEHLVQLEAAQIRTSAFYATLDTNQKTIFDLFWHELHHRMSGHDQGSNAPVGRISPLVA